MEVNLEKETGLVEAVLFLDSEPLNVDAIARISQLAPQVVEQCLEVLLLSVVVGYDSAVGEHDFVVIVRQVHVWVCVDEPLRVFRCLCAGSRCR